MKRKPKYHQRIVKGKPVSLSPSPWDMGATGPANRHGLEIEEAADINPETGEVQNPNGVCCGVKRILVDGEPVTSILPISAGSSCRVTVEMG